jgi:hypothetical protein
VETHKRYFRVTGRDLVYLKFILEAYEGLATMSTADKANGIVSVTYSDCFAATVDALLTALSGEISLSEVNSPVAE